MCTWAQIRRSGAVFEREAEGAGRLAGCVGAEGIAVVDEAGDGAVVARYRCVLQDDPICVGGMHPAGGSMQEHAEGLVAFAVVGKTRGDAVAELESKVIGQGAEDGKEGAATGLELRRGRTAGVAVRDGGWGGGNASLQTSHLPAEDTQSTAIAGGSLGRNWFRAVHVPS